MMRSGRVDYGDLEKRDPGFIAAYEAEKEVGRRQNQEQAADGRRRSRDLGEE